jgi:peptidoglycan/xylan/chitin deacetylase (PgdA/CDA1 family)
MSRRLLVLGWHNVDPTPAFPAREESAPGHGRRHFTRQLELLERFTNVVRLDDALRRLQAGQPLPPRAVALTFDDGYRDNVDLVVPTLSRIGLPATFFLVPGFLSRQLRVWWEDLAHAFERATVDELVWRNQRYQLDSPAARRAVHDSLLPTLKRLDRRARQAVVAEIVQRLKPPQPPSMEDLFLDWEGACRLVSAGHTIAAHSMTHPILSREHEDEQATEIGDSRRVLQSRLGTAIDLLAYPNGTATDYDATTTREAQKAGYLGAVTTRTGLASGWSSAYEVPRVILGPETDVRSAVRFVWWTARDRHHARLTSRDD